jgi:hypothetical protein
LLINLVISNRANECSARNAAIHRKGEETGEIDSEKANAGREVSEGMTTKGDCGSVESFALLFALRTAWFPVLTISRQ